MLGMTLAKTGLETIQKLFPLIRQKHFAKTYVNSDFRKPMLAKRSGRKTHIAFLR
jgi:hypothetical protein